MFTTGCFVGPAVKMLKKQSRTLHNVHRMALESITKCKDMISQMNYDKN